MSLPYWVQRHAGWPMEVLPLSSFQRLITNVSWNVIGKILVQIILLAVSIAVTRYLGKERLGIYASLLVIPVFMRLLNAFGMETLINKRLPELNVADPSGRQGRFLVGWLLLFRLITSLVFCALLWFILPVYLDFIRMPELLVYRVPILLYFLVVSVNSLLSTLFMTLLRYKVVAMTESVSALLNLILLGVFIYFDFAIFGVLYAYIFATGINILVLWVLARKDLSGDVEKPELKEEKHLAWVSYVISLVSFGLMTQSDIFMMNYFQVDPVRIGYYHLSTALAGMLIFMLTGTGPLALSLFSETYAREKSAGLSRSWLEVVGFAIFCIAPIYCFALFHGEQLITFIYGEAFFAAGGVFVVYLVFVVLSLFMGSGFSVSMLYVVQKRDAALRSSVEGSILNVGLNLILIPPYGEMGAVLATGSSMVYMAARQLLCLAGVLDVGAVFPFMGRCVLLALIPLVPSKLTAYFVVDHLLLNLLIYGAGLIGVLLWVRPLTEEHQRLAAETGSGLERWVKYFVRKPAK